MRTFIVILLLFCWIGCSSGDRTVITLELQDDPDILPYRFVQTGGEAGFYAPAILGPDSTLGEYCVLNMWRKTDTLSYVMFDMAPGPTKANIRQVNRKTTHFQWDCLYDFDNDLIDEVAVLYITYDSLKLEVLDPHNSDLYSQCLVVGQNRDGRGVWDGSAKIVDIADLNDDGFVEILVGCLTGFDSLPRCMYCVDWHNDTLLWTYDVAGHISTGFVLEDPSREKSEKAILFTTVAPNNIIRVGDMTDNITYLICLNERGERMWIKQLAGKFSKTAMYLFHRGDHSDPDVIVEASATRQAETKSDRFLVCNTAGQILDSLIMPPGKIYWETFDVDSDGNSEVIVSTDDRRVLIYNNDLELIREINSPRLLRVLAQHDVLGTGENQIFVGSNDGSLWLFDLNFEPLARLPEGGDPVFYHLNDSRTLIGVQVSGKTRYFEMYEVPWYTIFFRNPWLAFLAGALPLAIIAGVTWFATVRLRRKNRIIAAQHDKLDSTLSELEQTQTRLIAAEKYRQAKDIAGGVAHEIHNALGPARHSIELLKERLARKTDQTDDSVAELVGLVEEAVTRGAQMTELVTAYSRLETEKAAEPIKLAQVLAEVVTDNRSRIAELEVSVNAAIPDQFIFAAGRTHVYSLFNNLMLNALDALSEAEQRSITVSAETRGNMLKIEFADSGRGIPPESMPRIFDLFYSTKPSKGTGIGLAMVKKIVELYDGTIEVESIVDKRTKFTILLPYTQQVSATKEI